MEIAASPPAQFQNRIRNKYPLFETGGTTELPKDLPKDLVFLMRQASPLLSSSESITNKFSTETGSRFISLGSSFVALSETVYTEWQHFRDELVEAKSALEAEYHPSFYNRVGLRYVNTLDQRKLGLVGRNWRDLLNSQFIGLLGNAELSPHVSAFNIQTTIDLVEILPGAKATIRSSLSIEPDGQRFVLDSDFYVAERTGAENVIQILNQFNELDGRLFRWLVPRSNDLWRALQPN